MDSTDNCALFNVQLEHLLDLIIDWGLQSRAILAIEFVEVVASNVLFFIFLCSCGFFRGHINVVLYFLFICNYCVEDQINIINQIKIIDFSLLFYIFYFN